jgi:hypothetical protein
MARRRGETGDPMLTVAAALTVDYPGMQLRRT